MVSCIFLVMQQFYGFCIVLIFFGWVQIGECCVFWYNGCEMVSGMFDGGFCVWL